MSEDRQILTYPSGSARGLLEAERAFANIRRSTALFLGGAGQRAWDRPKSRAVVQPRRRLLSGGGGAGRDALIKYRRSGSEEAEDELHAELEKRELEVTRLEDEGRFRFIVESDPATGRRDALRQLVAEGVGDGRTLWININWEERTDLDTALRHQEEITDYAEDSGLVVSTCVLEPELDD